MKPQCRAVKGKVMPSRCDLDQGHRGPHCNEWGWGFHWWLRRGQKSFSGARGLWKAGETAGAMPWEFRLLAKTRACRLRRIARR